MKVARIHWLSTILAGFCLTSLSFGQVFDEKFDHWPTDLTINGRIIAADTLDEPSGLRNLLRRLSPQSSVGMMIDSKSDNQLFDSETITTKVADHFNTEDLTNLLQNHQIVVLDRSTPLSSEEKKTTLSLKSEFTGFIKRGGTLITIGNATNLLASGDQSLQLLPDVHLLTNYSSERNHEELIKVLTEHPKTVGIGLEPNTALVLAGRKMAVMGAGGANFLLAGNDREGPRKHRIIAQTHRSQSREQIYLDLTQWRRDAIDRTLPEFPSKTPRRPKVDNGTLIMVGGGRNPKGITQKMIELAGGLDQARLVYIPCTENEQVRDQQSIVEAWKQMGVKHATFIHTKDRNKANNDEQFLAPLKEATCLYFGGGRQWNFADSYYGTKAHQLMKDVLKRGGVIAGSSAGASIQARYLARATPINNVKIMAFGYERGGLGFLDGVAIDQHFSQRRRQADMTQLVNKYPQLLGIGIDEQTAIIVQQSTARVVGAGQVYFYDRTRPIESGKPDYIKLSAGDTFDLVKRRKL